MASLLSRFTTFVPNTTILSNDHNQELNRIVNLLNGTTTNLKTALKTSDAGDPPLELDQLSTGPIQEWYQGGVLKAQISNAGNYLFNQSGGFIGDQNGNELLKFAVAASAVNELTMQNGATGAAPAISSTGGDTNIDLVLAPKGTGVVKIQSGAPVAGTDAANKTYVDGKFTAFSLAFGIADPTAPTVGAVPSGAVTWVCPDGNAVKVTKVSVVYQTNSHTAGGSVSFQLQKRTAASSWSSVTNFGTVTLDDTNNVPFDVFTNDIVDESFAPGDTLIVFVSARSGTVTERDVSVVAIGIQTVSA